MNRYLDLALTLTLRQIPNPIRPGRSSWRAMGGARLSTSRIRPTFSGKTRPPEPAEVRAPVSDTTSRTSGLINLRTAKPLRSRRTLTYTPPGVEITFGELVRSYGYTPPTTGGGTYGVYLNRHDGVNWPGGNLGMMVPYEQLNASNSPSIGLTPPVYANNDVIIVAQETWQGQRFGQRRLNDPSVAPPTPTYPTNAYPRGCPDRDVRTAISTASSLKGTRICRSRYWRTIMYASIRPCSRPAGSSVGSRQSIRPTRCMHRTDLHSERSEFGGAIPVRPAELQYYPAH